MTGYGRGEAEVDGARAVVEIRSVNHRFLDLKLRGASLGMELEEAVRSRVKGALSRGSVTVTFRSESATRAHNVSIDTDTARRAFRSLRDLADSLGLERPTDLSLLCSLPGVVVTSDADDTDDKDDSLTAAALAAVERALEALVSMRGREGEILARDLRERVARIETLAQTLAKSSAVAPERAQKRLAERIERLLANGKLDIDSDRIAQEVALLADRLDVTEELVRVRAHLEQVGKLMDDAKKAIGRRLDFLVQELGREFNTVASKSQSADISSTVVEAKAELERLREQVQNIE